MADAIRLRLLQAIDDHDPDGFHLLLELALAQLGADDTTAIVTSIPAIVPSAQVPRALAFIHGTSWLSVARSVVLSACHQLAEAGAIPGTDFSYSQKNGRPILHMSSELYGWINEINPASLHLVRQFLHVHSA